MKIALYAYPEVYGGLMRHVELLGEGLSGKHHVTVIIPEVFRQNLRVPSLKGLNIEHFVVKGKFNLLGFFNLYKFLSKMKPDVFHVHLSSPGESTLPFLASHLAGIPITIATEHSPAYFPLEKFYSKSLKRFCMKFIDKVIAISESAESHLIERFAINPKKLSVVYNGVRIMTKVPKEEKMRIRGKLGIREDFYVITTTSEITERKGIDMIFKMAEQLIKKVGKIHFLLIGEGPRRKEFEQQYKDYMDSHYITFLGYQRDLKPYLSISDFFIVLPSLGEEVPFSLLEAMATGVPVIAAYIGEIPQMVNSLRRGLFLKDRDVAELCSALLQLMADKSLAHSLSRNARRLIETRFSLSAMVEQTQEIYRSLLVEKRGTF